MTIYHVLIALPLALGVAYTSVGWRDWRGLYSARDVRTIERHHRSMHAIGRRCVR